MCSQPGQITSPAHTCVSPHIERPGSSWRTYATMPLSSPHRPRLAIGLRCQATVVMDLCIAESRVKDAGRFAVHRAGSLEKRHAE
jgi:hypothetical protein